MGPEQGSPTWGLTPGLQVGYLFKRWSPSSPIPFIPRASRSHPCPPHPCLHQLSPTPASLGSGWPVSAPPTPNPVRSALLSTSRGRGTFPARGISQQGEGTETSHPGILLRYIVRVHGAELFNVPLRLPPMSWGPLTSQVSLILSTCLRGQRGFISTSPDSPGFRSQGVFVPGSILGRRPSYALPALSGAVPWKARDVSFLAASCGHGRGNDAC